MNLNDLVAAAKHVFRTGRITMVNSGQMPRYFFHVIDDVDAADEEGMFFDGPEAAVRYARMSVRELAADEVRRGKLCLDHRIIVEMEGGEAVATLFFRDVVEIEG